MDAGPISARDSAAPDPLTLAAPSLPGLGLSSALVLLRCALRQSVVTVDPSDTDSSCGSVVDAKPTSRQEAGRIVAPGARPVEPSLGSDRAGLLPLAVLLEAFKAVELLPVE